MFCPDWRSLAAVVGAFALAASGGARAGDAGGPPEPAREALAGKPLAANAWVNLGVRFDGGCEVGWVYDDANKLFLKYGGCCDGAKVPQWKNQGETSMRDTPGYSNRMVAFDPAAGSWKELVAFDPAWPKDRPPNGCTRGMVWDQERKAMWLWGGNASYGWGDYHELWKFDAAGKKFTPTNAAGKAQLKENIGSNTCVLGCDPRRGLIVVANAGHYYYAVYDIARNAWTVKKQPAGLGAGGYNALPWDPVSGKFFYLGMAGTGKKQEAKPAAEEPGTAWFKYTNAETKKDEWFENRAATWSYDPGADKWEKANPKHEPPPRSRGGFAYDSRNKVFILVGGCGGTWDKDERFFNDTWIYDPAANDWTDPKPNGKPAFGPWATRTWLELAYAPEYNAVVCAVEGGSGLWAYRYK